jgi:hypothetical protein
MTRKLEIPDDKYEILANAASRSGKTPQDMLANLISGLRDPRTDSHYFETDDWFRHLGATDDMIDREKREVRLEAQTDADT